MQSIEDNTADRELKFSRLLNAPIELVWEVWTDPEHIKHWWGPAGFTNTITKMEIKEGGEWDLVMHSPDGIHYSHKCVFRKVEKPKKIVYEHLTHPKYIATIQLESRGDTTFLMWHLLFESNEYLVHAANTFKVDAGLQQTGEKLISYLAQLTIG